MCMGMTLMRRSCCHCLNLLKVNRQILLDSQQPVRASAIMNKASFSDVSAACSSMDRLDNTYGN
jgi:hypothetical protein